MASNRRQSNMSQPDPFKLTKREENQILQNSVERMINTSIQLAQHLEDSKDERIKELASISWQDWEELKQLIVKLWNRERNDIFIRREAEQKGK